MPISGAELRRLFLCWACSNFARSQDRRSLVRRNWQIGRKRCVSDPMFFGIFCLEFDSLFTAPGNANKIFTPCIYIYVCIPFKEYCIFLDNNTFVSWFIPWISCQTRHIKFCYSRKIYVQTCIRKRHPPSVPYTSAVSDTIAPALLQKEHKVGLLSSRKKYFQAVQ